MLFTLYHLLPYLNMDSINDKPNKVLLTMSISIALGMLSTFLFQVIDTYFVGQLGAEALTALSFASTLYFLMVGLFIGLAVGVSILIGRAYGAGEGLQVKQITFIALGFSLFFTLILTVLGITSLGPLFSAMGAESNVLPLIQNYLKPLLWGMPLLTLGLTAGGALRATGRVLQPELLMVLAGVANLLLDYALIFGEWGFPQLGIKGAALATVFSWVIVFLGMMIFLWKEGLLQLRLPAWFQWKKVIGQIFHLSTPTIVSQMIGPLTLMYLTFLLAKESAEAVAAFGIAGRIETLVMIGILGVSTALTPFIAQNVGARQKERVEQAIVFGGKASTYLGIVVTAILFVTIRPMATLFSENPIIVKQTSQYFYIVSLSYCLYGLYLVTAAIFNGLALTMEALRISFAKSFFFTIPLTWVASYWGVIGIFAGVSFSNLLAGVFAAWRMRKELDRVDSKLLDEPVLHNYWKDFKSLLNN